MNTRQRSTALFTLLATCLLGAAAAFIALEAGSAEAKTKTKPAKSVGYPDGYRSWAHVKSMWLSDKHGLADPFAGLHHVYANPKAVTALRSKGAFPAGSVIAFDLFEAAPKEEAMVEGKRKFLGVMQKDNKRWPKTGGWGFEVFVGDSQTKRAVKDGGVSCFACHRGMEANGYVFSQWRN